MIMVLVYYPSSQFHLSINQVSFQSLQDMARTGIHYEKWFRGDNSINMQDRNMVLGFCPSPHCHLSIYQVLFKCQQQFLSYSPDKVPDGQTDGQSGGYMLSRLGSIKIRKIHGQLSKVL